MTEPGFRHGPSSADALSPTPQPFPSWRPSVAPSSAPLLCSVSPADLGGQRRPRLRVTAEETSSSRPEAVNSTGRRYPSGFLYFFFLNFILFLNFTKLY